MTAKGTFFPRRINDHVPNMQYAADVRFGGLGTVVIPAPSAAATFVAALAGGASAVTPVNATNDAKFGRNVTVTASAATGADATIIIRGKDYLGQPMVEQITVTNANGTTTQVGKKAFKYVDSLEVGTPADGSQTFAIGWGNVLGLPYKSQKLISELVNKEVPTNPGALVDGLATGSAQSATSDDPRGTYAPASQNVPNGAREYELTIMHDYDNLHGDAHYYA